MVQAVTVIRNEGDASRVAEIPTWAMQLIYRLGRLQRGHAYTLTVVMTGDEPVWTVQPLGKLENER